MESNAVRNLITVRGELISLPAFSHENHGKNFFQFSLEVPRLSGAIDVLPVIADEAVMNGIDLSGGSMITVCGQIRSHNIRRDGRRHLMIFIFASSITAEDGPPINEVDLDAIICRVPTFRRTPLGREICDVMLAVPRAFHRADYLPCIFWGRTAGAASGQSIGDRVIVHGRLQSRVYTKLTEEGAQEHTAYEVSALSAEFFGKSEEDCI